MPIAPSPWLITDLTPEVIKALDGSIQTGAGRAGSRSTIYQGATPPLLRFSDITSGPSSGLGDSLGVGSIVTLWGQNIGETQGNGKVYFTDSNSVKREAAHVYYWKRADGSAPGGPANLWASHRMLEIAFSLPSSMAGAGTITVEIGGVVSTSLPFTVRSGRILWVAPDGDNANAGTSYSAPKEFINGNIASTSIQSFGNARLQAGDIVYSRSVQEPSFSGGGRNVGCYLRSCVGTAAEPIALVPYPGAFSNIQAEHMGLLAHFSAGIVTSKYRISVGWKSPSAPANAEGTSLSNAHITATAHGRSVGNYMIENSGTMFNGWNGAIYSGGESINHIILGNHLFDLGDDNTSHFQHTLYMSVRNSDVVAQVGECSFNYLQDNKAKFGIHYYDQSDYGSDGGACGIVTGTLKINNNVIVNQKGPGINVSGRDLTGRGEICWGIDVDIVGNLLVNVGLGPVAEANNGTSPLAISVGGAIDASNIWVDSNTIYGFSDPTSRPGQPVFALNLNFSNASPYRTVTNNLFWNDFDASWLSNGTVGIETFTDNLFFNTAGTINAITPSGQTYADPRVTFDGALMSLLEDSPLVNAGNSKRQTVNLYGQISNNIGAV